MMNKIEIILRNRKDDLANIEVPSELEGRLRKALDNKIVVKRRKFIGLRIVAVSLIILLLGYNFDTLAFYGKKIMGYDDIMNGTLKELNELGQGQIIDKSYTFKNGITIILDGIMIDDNQLLAYYTIQAPKGNVNEIVTRVKLEGLIGEYTLQSGQGEMNDEETIMKNIQSIDPPYFFEKTLHFKFQLLEDGKAERGEIKFKLDRDKAMGHILKKNINKSIQIGKTKIHFDSILASPTRTSIKGSIQSIIELVKDEINSERLRPNELELKLIANGKEIPSQSSGMRTGIKGITFEKNYGPLPKNLKSLKLKLVSFSSDHDVNKMVDLKKDSLNQSYYINGQEIVVNKIYEQNERTLINITTEKSVLLSEVCLLIDNKVVELNRTIENKYEKLMDGKILHTRTLEFSGVGKSYKLDIRRITYTEKYNKIIEIPIE